MDAAPDGFYTMKGYSLLSSGKITSAMEDYIEMIARIKRGDEVVRVVDLSSNLHVKASSVTKMIQQLRELGLVSAEKYGNIELTKKGAALSEYLLYRHEVLHRLLCYVNSSSNELEQVEKIEHFINEQTIKNLDLLYHRILEKYNKSC